MQYLCRGVSVESAADIGRSPLMHAFYIRDEVTSGGVCLSVVHDALHSG